MDEKDQSLHCQFKRWLRRTTIFYANALYLLAAVGAAGLPWLLEALSPLLDALFSVGWRAYSGVVLSCVYELGFLALPCMLYAGRHKGVELSMRLTPPRPRLMVYAVMAAICGLFFVSNLGVLWLWVLQSLGGRTASGSLSIPTTPDMLARQILLVAVVPGVCEELLFRGAILGSWERKGADRALLVSSVLFCLLHGSIQGLPTQLLLGFVIGYIVLSSGSIYTGMIYHTVHNGMSLVFAYLGNVEPTEGAADLYQNAAGYIAQNGGTADFIARLLISGLLFGGALLLFRLDRMRTGEAFDKVPVPDKTPVTWQELLVLLAGLVTVGTFYVRDFLMICGLIGE